MSDIPKCDFPDCERSKQSKGKKTNQRRKWCAYHHRGNGKEARLEYSKTLPEVINDEQ